MAPMSEGHRLSGVEIFATGNHRGKPYTVRDLDQIVSNFDRASRGESPRLAVPAVLGHEERQELLERTDIPAAGWVRRVYRQGDRLKADIDDVAPQVARLLKGKRYRKVSAEIYTEPPSGISGRGMMLRRVAFLGGEIPQVKGLADIPTPEPYCERRPSTIRFTESRPAGTGRFIVFSEVTPMSREEMLAALAEKGMDTALLSDAVPDELLAEMLRVLSSHDEPDGDEQVAEESPAEQEMAEDADVPAPEGEQADEEMAEDEAGPTDAESAKAYLEKAMKHYEAARKHFEKYNAPEEKGKGEDVQVATMSEQKVAALVEAAVAKALKTQAKGAVAELRKFSEEQVASQKKLAVDAFCESRLKAGKILPAELDPANPANLKARLLRADSRSTVAKFSEKGKTVELTELDLQMREVDARPAFKFGERIVATKPGEAAEDEQVAEIESHYEQFSEQFGRAGVTKDRFVSGFKAERKMNPKLTAADFLRR